MDLQFDLSIGDRNLYKLKFVADNNLQEFSDTDIPKFKEYEKIALHFRSTNVSSRVHVEDMADFQLPRQKVVGNDAVFLPNGEEITIFDFKNKKQPTPLIPGYYTIKVVDDGSNYYSYFQVVPKDLSVPEWKKLRFEIENVIGGLARDNLNRRQKSDSLENSDRKDKYFFANRLEQFLHVSSKLQSSVEFLRNEAKYKVATLYKWQHAGESNVIDKNSIRKMAERPDRRQLVYVPKHYLEYDVAENRWIKYMIRSFIEFCHEGKTYYEKTIVKLQDGYLNLHEQKYFSYRSSQDKEYLRNHYQHERKVLMSKIDRLSMLLSYFESVMNDEFLQGVSERRSQFTPKALVLSPRYNIVYKVYLIITKKADEFSLAPKYHFYWKQTALLYEIWGFITVLRILIENGYEAEKGWIFDSITESEVLPFLEEGTKVQLRSKKLNINLVYNEQLLSENHKNTLQLPVKTGSNRNKPDIRLDLFTLENKFIGSIIIDMKYRKLSNIINTKYSRKTIEQLREYRNDVTSDILDFPEQIRTQLKTVQAVFAIYPGNDDVSVPVGFEEQEIYFNKMKPGFGDDKFYLNLAEQINKREELHNSVK